MTATDSKLEVNGAVGNAYEIPPLNTNGAGDEPFGLTADMADETVKNAPTAANHCWTAIGADPAAIDTKRAVLGGYVASINTCLKHAIDGYSFWGITIIAKVGKDW